MDRPAALDLAGHALAPVAQLAVLDVVSAKHYGADMTLGLGSVFHDREPTPPRAATLKGTCLTSDETNPAPRRFANTVLVLQGGGALGSYQGGVFEGLVAAGVEPDWVAGISIGALNAALIAGNPPERRVERLRAFWETICRQPWFPSWPAWPALTPAGSGMQAAWPAAWQRWMSQVQTTRAVFEGQNGFFVPRTPPLAVLHDSANAAGASYYDTAPLRATLERFVDFDRINHPGAMRVSVGAVKVTTGELVYFDNRHCRRPLGPEHFMASGALPPALPAVEVEGEFYWDGGIVLNTPLLYVLMEEPRRDTLAIQVDLWNAVGPAPTSLPEVEERQKEILYSSRTSVITAYMHDSQVARRRIADVLELLSPEQRRLPAAERAAELACDRRCNVVQLICTDAEGDGSAKDHDFGVETMHNHWRSGLADIERTLADPRRLDMPSARHPFVVHGLRSMGSSQPKAAL